MQHVLCFQAISLRKVLLELLGKNVGPENESVFDNQISGSVVR